MVIRKRYAAALPVPVHAEQSGAAAAVVAVPLKIRSLPLVCSASMGQHGRQAQDPVRSSRSPQQSVWQCGSGRQCAQKCALVSPAAASSSLCGPPRNRHDHGCSLRGHRWGPQFMVAK
ncbi:hypothetical protein NDU88_003974 [Pleurodeles waltl]|uniref:Uncharacterized protein n=1 Tax=Pleurodeles waltl TaxID=8319 RepID=A0AAV7RHT1_PLEWA|nr:hypothetical protein NDU88_003974 [Pleurodeles waltl]